MLKHLIAPIARCLAEIRKQPSMLAIEDEQLSLTILLSIGQQVMLTTNLWVKAGLVNGALGQVVAILYNISTTPSNFPLFVVINFMHYKGPPWDNSIPNYVPILPITRGSRR